jgi:hypothetical protein
MNIPSSYLGLLETKTNPKPHKPIEIKINPKKDVIDEEPKELIEMEEDKPDEITVRKPISIIDKRKQPEFANFDRDIVLQKLRQKNLLTVKVGEPDNRTNKSVIEIKDIPPLMKTDTTIIIGDKSEPEVVEEEELEPEVVEEKEPEPEVVEEKEPEPEVVEEKEPEPEVVEEKEPEPEVVEEKEPEPEVVEEKEPEPEVVIEPKKRGRKPRAKKGEPIDKELLDKVDLTTAVIRSQKVIDRLPKEREKNLVLAPPYYLNNRKLFINKLKDLFKPRENEIKEMTGSVSCDKSTDELDFDLLTHQKIVRDYLNLYTPYRGLLLYHGLGSGKTCTSIAIAEGMKTTKKVVVMTPASLKMNFFSELKKCGDDLYKKNQYWEFVSIDGKPEYTGILSRALSLPAEYVRNNGGAWLLDIKKEPNYSIRSADEQKQIDEQLNQMIRSKYLDINYNGLNNNVMNKITENSTINPFDNSVVIIDEAHNFVSRIVNKIKSPNSISYKMYDYLMSAKDARIVFLTGTPIINYPNEIGILFNILRGYIKTWSINVNVTTNVKVDTSYILKILDQAGLRTFDYVNYSGNVLTITRNPYGFINSKKRGQLKGTQKQKPVKHDGKTRKLKGGATDEVFERYNGVTLNDAGNISDDDFIKKVLNVLAKHGLETTKAGVTMTNNKSLMDKSDDFISTFVDEDSENAKNMNLFQRRILGLTSYFRSAQEDLLPRFEITEEGDVYHVVKSEMSGHQFSIYEAIRKDEAEREKNIRKRQRKAGGKGEELFNVSSTYRIFSRSACNFTFPDEIKRPVPDADEKAIGEMELDIIPDEVVQEADVYANVEDNDDRSKPKENYAERIEKALELINQDDESTMQKKYLTGAMLEMLSPKFYKILLNIVDAENKGLHLLYSNFRTLEGIGILRLVLLANGFAEFKIQKENNEWQIIEKEEDEGKPRFVLYTGTETAEEKEIVRNIYNGSWEFVPQNLANKLRQEYENNLLGEVIKVFMITSSGAEGINLKNTRYVHIVEPYWHMVRPDQVVGRARRICSHQDLPEELRTVKVFLYVTTLSEQQRIDEKNIELRIRDVSRFDKKTPVTTDENLYEIASQKQKINNQILQAVKETAIDCNVYANTSKDHPIVCYGVGKVESNSFNSYPSFDMDKQHRETKEMVEKEVEAVEFKLKDGRRFVKIDNDVFDFAAFEEFQNKKRQMPDPIGKFEEGKLRFL